MDLLVALFRRIGQHFAVGAAHTTTWLVMRLAASSWRLQRLLQVLLVSAVVRLLLQKSRFQVVPPVCGR